MLSDYSDPNYNIEKILNDRLEATRHERNILKDNIDALDTKIKVLLTKMGQRPRESEGEVNEKMRTLEYEHSTRPQTNADERKFMRDIDKLKQKKKSLADYNALQMEVDEYRTRRAALQNDLKEKDRVLDDLYQGARRMKAAMKLGCSAAEIVERRVTVPEDKISRVIGRGGANIKQIEIDCNVLIESETRAGAFRVLGKEESIVAADEKLAVLVNTISEEFSILEEAAVCLTLGKGSLLQQIQSLCGVRIDISKPKRLCNVTGLPDNVAQAKAEILAVRCARVEIPFEESVLPFIIGKGGQTIRALEVEHSVQLEVSREAKLIVVLGFEDDVATAATTISNIIHENKELEELIELDRNTIVGCIIGAKGVVVRNLQKELNVHIHSKKVDDDSTANSNMEYLCIRGTASNIIPAKLKIMEIVNEYQSQTEIIAVTEELMPQLVGKKGVRITALREEHPNVQIDIDTANACVRLFSADSDARLAAKTAVLEVIRANQRGEIYMDLETTVALKGARGLSLRSVIQNELGLSMDILSEAEVVRVRGNQESVQRAMVLLEEFRENNFTVEIPCFDEDSNSLFRGGETSPGKSIEQKFDVEISQDRKKGILRIRGSKTAVDLAEKAVNDVLQGGEDGGTRLVEADASAMSAFIGKGGSNIKKLEAQYTVQLDILRSRGFIRIRGEPANVLQAKHGIMTFFQSQRISAQLVRPKDIAAADMTKILKDSSSLFFGIDVEIGEFEIIIRGPQRLVNDAKEYISELFSGNVNYSIALLDHQYSSLAANADVNFKQIRDNNKVSVDMDENKQSIKISGALNNVTKAMIQLYRMLDYLFPSEFASISLDPVALVEVGSYSVVDEIAEKTGCALEVNMHLLMVRVRGPSLGVAAAAHMIRQMQGEWKKRVAVIPVVEYTIPVILGKKGGNIAAIENDTGTSISVDRLGQRVIVTGPTEEQVTRATTSILAKLESFEKEHFEIVLDERLFGKMIGKQGANVNKLRSETGASIDMDAKTLTVKVDGPEDKVSLAKEKILAFVAEQKKDISFSVKVRVPAVAFPLVIGTKGGTVQRIQNTCSVRLDLDRNEQVATIKGSPEGCAQAVSMIRDLLAEDGMDSTSLSIISSGTTNSSQSSSNTANSTSGSIASAEPVISAVDFSVEKIDKGEMAELEAIASRVNAEMASKGLSKSALKRLRKKTRAEGSTDQDLDTEEYTPVSAESATNEIQSSYRDEVPKASANGAGNGVEKAVTSFPLPRAPDARDSSQSVSTSMTSLSSVLRTDDSSIKTNQYSSSFASKPIIGNGNDNLPPLGAPPGIPLPYTQSPLRTYAAPAFAPSLATSTSQYTSNQSAQKPEGKAGELLALLLGSSSTSASSSSPSLKSAEANAVLPPPPGYSPNYLTKHYMTANKTAAERPPATASHSLGSSLSGSNGNGRENSSSGTSAPSSATNTQYFKSKSGFSIRL